MAQGNLVLCRFCSISKHLTIVFLPKQKNIKNE